MRVLFGCGLATAAVVSGCGGDGNGPNQDQFVGTWNATSVVYTNQANTAQKVDLVAEGATVVVVLAASGNYIITATLPGEAPDVTTGTWSASADVLTLHETGVAFSLQFDWNLAGSTLTISGADSEFDFNGDGVPEAAKLGVVLERQ